ncbi:MAG: hypothetical protein SNJ78_02490, partial [Spirochaetales bacterium]
MKRTILYETHKALQAKLVSFAGWEMPLQYPSGPIEEHRRVRRSAGLFDTSHMGRLRVTGAGSQAFLDNLLTARLSDLSPGFSRYSLMLRQDGGVLDDLFVYRLKEQEWLLVVNASNTEKDLNWIQNQAANLAAGSVEVEDISEKLGMLAFQGPRALEVVRKIFTQEEGKPWIPPERLGWAWGWLPQSSSLRCLLGRTGYTGEDGVEIFPPWEQTPMVFHSLLKAAQDLGIEAGPAGLAA